jgi:translation initiation factor IF-1
MKVEEAIVLEGTIRYVLAGTMFRVELPSKHIVMAHIAGRMRSASSA